MPKKKNDYNNESIVALKGAERVRKRPGEVAGKDGRCRLGIVAHKDLAAGQRGGAHSHRDVARAARRAVVGGADVDELDLAAQLRAQGKGHVDVDALQAGAVGSGPAIRGIGGVDAHREDALLKRRARRQTRDLLDVAQSLLGGWVVCATRAQGRQAHRRSRTQPRHKTAARHRLVHLRRLLPHQGARQARPNLLVKRSPRLTWYLTPHSRAGAFATDAAAPSLEALSPAGLFALKVYGRHDLLLGRAMLTPARTRVAYVDPFGRVCLGLRFAPAGAPPQPQTRGEPA